MSANKWRYICTHQIVYPLLSTWLSNQRREWNFGNTAFIKNGAVRHRSLIIYKIKIQQLKTFYGGLTIIMKKQSVLQKLTFLWNTLVNEIPFGGFVSLDEHSHRMDAKNPKKHIQFKSKYPLIAVTSCHSKSTTTNCSLKPFCSLEYNHWSSSSLSIFKGANNKLAKVRNGRIIEETTGVINNSKSSFSKDPLKIKITMIQTYR